MCMSTQTTKINISEKLIHRRITHMKTYTEALNESRSDFRNNKSSSIDKDRRRVVESLMLDYGVKSVNDLSEADKNYMKSQILTYWDPRRGLTADGKRYLRDGTTRLNESADNEKIAKYIENSVKQDINDWILKISNKKADEKVNELVNKIEIATKKKISKESVVTAIMNIVSPALKQSMLK